MVGAKLSDVKWWIANWGIFPSDGIPSGSVGYKLGIPCLVNRPGVAGAVLQTPL